MALGPMAWMAMTLAVVILSLTFGPGWSVAFLILVGVIFGEVHEGKQEEPKKQNLPDSAPARGVQDDVIINVADDAPDHAPADVVDASADALALSVDAPTPVVDAPAFLADASALSGDSLAPAVDAPADAALSVDAPVDAPADAPAISVDAQVDAPAISVDAQVDAPAISVDAPVDASALAPAVNATGLRMRRKRKLVLKLDLHDDRDKSKAMRLVSQFEGVESLNLDTKDNKLTMIGDFDPIKVVNKLRKSWHTDIVNVGSSSLTYHYGPTYPYEPNEEQASCVIC